MIQVQLMRSETGLKGFQIRGHAGYAPHGQDIVCAAASFLATTVVNSLEVQLGQPAIVKQEEGFLSCTLPEGLSEGQRQLAESILQTLVIGFKDLREAYPRNISIQNVRIKGGAWK